MCHILCARHVRALQLCYYSDHLDACLSILNWQFRISSNELSLRDVGCMHDCMPGRLLLFMSQGQYLFDSVRARWLKSQAYMKLRLLCHCQSGAPLFPHGTWRCSGRRRTYSEAYLQLSNFLKTALLLAQPSTRSPCPLATRRTPARSCQPSRGRRA